MCPEKPCEVGRDRELLPGVGSGRYVDVHVHLVPPVKSFFHITVRPSILLALAG